MYNNIMKTLFTIGDSFTYGQELANPLQHAWPRLVADSLGCSIINDGSPGVGNEYMVKKTMQVVGELKPDLVIVGWSSCGRQEHADEWGAYDIWPGCNNRVFDEDPKLQYRKELIKYITLYNNEEHEYRRWLRQVILLQSFLKCYNVDYRFVSAFDNQHRNEKYMKDNQGYADMIDVSKFIGWPTAGLVEWAYNSPIGPGGHPLEEGHKKIAEKIIETLRITR